MLISQLAELRKLRGKDKQRGREKNKMSLGTSEVIVPPPSSCMSNCLLKMVLAPSKSAKSTRSQLVMGSPLQDSIAPGPFSTLISFCSSTECPHQRSLPSSKRSPSPSVSCKSSNAKPLHLRPSPRVQPRSQLPGRVMGSPPRGPVVSAELTALLLGTFLSPHLSQRQLPFHKNPFLSSAAPSTASTPGPQGNLT